MEVRFLMCFIACLTSFTTTFASLNCESEEEELMEHLFRNYSKHVRPSITHEHTLNMTFGIAYVQLVKLDDREMTLVSNVWIRQHW